MTFTLTEVLLLILTMAACIVSFFLARTLHGVDKAVRDIAKTMEEFRTLGRKLDRVVEETERTMTSVRRLSDEGCAVVENLSATAAHVRETVEEGIDQFRGLLGPMRLLPMLIAGVKAGFEAYGRLRSRDDEPADDETGDSEPEEGGTP